MEENEQPQSGPPAKDVRPKTDAKFSGRPGSSVQPGCRDWPMKRSEIALANDCSRHCKPSTLEGQLTLRSENLGLPWCISFSASISARIIMGIRIALHFPTGIAPSPRIHLDGKATYCVNSRGLTLHSKPILRLIGTCSLSRPRIVPRHHLTTTSF